jgi:hypothetical protein
VTATIGKDLGVRRRDGETCFNTFIVMSYIGLFQNETGFNICHNLLLKIIDKALLKKPVCRVVTD